jgi:hypothetical protein
MIGITLGISHYYAMAEESAKRVRELCNIDAYIASDRDYSKFRPGVPQFLKFYLFDMTDEEDVMFFDPDLITLHPYDPKKFTALGDLVCVRDVPNDFGKAEAEFLGFPAENYFNAGWFIVNRRQHRDLFEYCKQTSKHLMELWLAADPTKKVYRENPIDNILHDQAILNQVVYRTGTKLRLVDWRYNFMLFDSEGIAAKVTNLFSIHLISETKKHFQDVIAGSLVGRQMYEVDDAGFEENAARYYHFEGGLLRAAFWLRPDGTVDGCESMHYWFLDIHGRLVLTEWGAIRLVMEPIAPFRWVTADGKAEIRRV